MKTTIERYAIPALDKCKATTRKMGAYTFELAGQGAIPASNAKRDRSTFGTLCSHSLKQKVSNVPSCSRSCRSCEFDFEAAIDKSFDTIRSIGTALCLHCVKKGQYTPERIYARYTNHDGRSNETPSILQRSSHIDYRDSKTLGGTILSC